MRKAIIIFHPLPVNLDVKVISLKIKYKFFWMKFKNICISSYLRMAILTHTLLLLTTVCYGNNNIYGIKNVLHQPKIYDNFYAPSIKSVKTYRTGRDLNNPIAELNSNESITVEFDDLSEETTSFDYTIIHCAYSWERSDLIFMDYCDGFEYNRVEDFHSSVGTTASYVHYALTFPNSNIKLKLSGNYVVQVVDSYDHSKIILQQRFMVVEPILSMKALVRQPLVQDLLKTSQQVELEVNYSPLGNIDPNNDIVTVICQNNQTDNSLVGIHPTYISSGNIRYTAPSALIFDGCNEYRNLDLKSFYYQTSKIQQIKSYGGEFHVSLAPDKDNCNGDYIENPDLNGKFIIKRDDSNDSQTEAEYSWVYFSLLTQRQDSSDVYLYGEMTGYTIDPAYKLNFNYRNGGYELRAQLKQGYYNYRYVTVNKSTGTISHAQLEGNHFETENSYQVTVYYKSPGIRYWRLVGIKTISSRYSKG